MRRDEVTNSISDVRCVSTRCASRTMTTEARYKAIEERMAQHRHSKVDTQIRTKPGAIDDRMDPTKYTEHKHMDTRTNAASGV